jgi:hypothetical protein
MNIDTINPLRQSIPQQKQTKRSLQWENRGANFAGESSNPKAEEQKDGRNQF